MGWRWAGEASSLADGLAGLIPESTRAEVATDELAAEAEAAAAAVRMDPGTGRALDGDGHYLGRVPVVRRGTPREVISLYCSRQGCSIMMPVTRAPAHDVIVRWFEDGLQLPAARTPARQHDHMNMLGRPQ